jgi:hypothetical protein
MSVEDIASQLRAVIAASGHGSEGVLRELRLFVSSPADVTAEREIVSRVVEEINARIGVTDGVLLRRYTWESLPAVEAQPQDAVAEILRQADIFLLILASRLGRSIGPSSTSATEQEYWSAVDSWQRTGRPQVLCYLKTTPVKIVSLDQLEQARRVLAFSDQLKRDGLVYEFESTADFEHAVRLHLTKIIQSARDRPMNG